MIRSLVVRLVPALALLLTPLFLATRLHAQPVGEGGAGGETPKPEAGAGGEAGAPPPAGGDAAGAGGAGGSEEPPKPKPEEDKKPAAKPKGENVSGGGPPSPNETPPPEEKKPPEHKGSFEFGAYGRVVAAADGEGGPGRDADIVAHGSRMDEDNYAELELRREDLWAVTGIKTNIVATLAVASPVFHYSGNFELNAAIRNLYLEARDIGLPGLSAWAGSRMVRGDDIYLLDWWPLDNLNLMGAGIGYKHDVGTSAQLVVGATQPDTILFKQTVERVAPLDQFGSVESPLLDRQKLIGALKISHNQRFGPKDKPGPGIKAVLYGEGYALPEGEREREPGAELEQLPSDGGFTIGGQFTAYTGVRDTFIHLFARYSGNLAAYGQFSSPGQLNAQKTTDGAREIVVAAAGNAEIDFFGVMMGAYFRSFRDASPTLDFQDVDEGAVVLRPTFFFGEIAGVSLEGTFEMAQRGVIFQDPDGDATAPEGPALASLFRIGIIPFISPAGRGNFSRPHIRLLYNLSVRDDTSRLLYPEDHPLRDREIEHFIGLGAEWWFNSSSYGF